MFLDTFPYNAHTSCSDSIWAGLPILTLEGDSFQSRVASSLLKTTGLNELITKNEKEYVEKAIYIAKNKEYLNQLKKKNYLPLKITTHYLIINLLLIILRRHTVSYLKNILMKKIQKMFIYN